MQLDKTEDFFTCPLTCMFICAAVLAKISLSFDGLRVEKETSTSTHFATTLLTSPPSSPPPAAVPNGSGSPASVARRAKSVMSNGIKARASLAGSELEAEISRLKQEFEDLVDSVEDSFTSRVPLKKILRSVKHIPVSLSQDLGSYFREESCNILQTNSIQHLFVLLAPMWGYLNPGLLEFFVGRFGSQDDISELQSYLDKLDTFRQNVKLGDFVRVRHTKENALDLFCCKKIITIMGSDWENQTLQDAENFRVQFAGEHNLQSFVPRMDIVPSSIAIVICLPHWLEINLDELCGFFNRKGVKNVFVDGPVDLIKKVGVLILVKSLASTCTYN